MQLIDPTAPAPDRHNERAPALATLNGLTIGLLSNGKANADKLIEKTAELLQARYGGTVVPVAYKPHPSKPAPGELLTNLSHECDYLITAAGD